MRNKAKKLNDKIILYASSEAERYMSRYVPFRDGHLRTSAVVGKGYVEYRMPYARYQYYGISHSGNPLQYHTPGTGSYWNERMMSAEGDQFIRQIQDYVRRL